MSFCGRQWAYQKVAETRGENSTLVIWGNKDIVTPFANAEKVMGVLSKSSTLLHRSRRQSSVHQ